MPNWEYEERAAAAGYTAVCGVDEAGAGPLAGPVYAGAVILPFGLELPYLNDSKQVTPKRRDGLFDLIREKAIAWSVASVSAEEIDEMDILNARMLVMQRAIDGLVPPAYYALIDGNRDHGSRCAVVTAHETIVKGDSRSTSIAAASILAKVSRDRHMEKLAEEYPQYLFDQHKGYGTKLHYAMLDQYGIEGESYEYDENGNIVLLSGEVEGNESIPGTLADASIGLYALPRMVVYHAVVERVNAGDPPYMQAKQEWRYNFFTELYPIADPVYDWGLWATATDEEAAVISETQNQLETYASELLADLILGNKSLDNLEEYQQELTIWAYRNICRSGRRAAIAYWEKRSNSLIRSRHLSL